MKTLVILICCHVLINAIPVQKLGDDFPVHENWGLSIYQFLDKYGYGYENHTVITEDGYILGLHRITTGQNDTQWDGSKPVVLLMHGLESSGMDFVNNGPKSGVALLLADKGYDVWLGNNRGNTFSKNHTTLSPSEKEFWNFSFHEIGIYDISAKIDYILEITGKANLTYVGHSQGTTTFFTLTASKPEYNDKVNLMVAMAPVAYMENAPHPFVNFLANPLVNLATGFGINLFKFYNILGHNELITLAGKYICYKDSPLLALCTTPIYVLGGYNPPQLDNDFVSVIVSSAPAGTSYKQMDHYFQEIRSGYFRPYDYGLVKNRELYGQASPPNYNTKKITAPVALFYAQKDLFAAVADVERLAKELPNLVVKNEIQLEDFTHLDFLWAIDINQYLNNDVLNLIDKYNGKSV